MAILAVMLSVGALRGKTGGGKTLADLETQLASEISSGGETAAEGIGEDEVSGGMSPKRKALLTFGLLSITVVYIGLMDWLGFVLATFFYIGSMLLALGMRAYGLIFTISFGTCAVVFLVFKTIMYINLPSGIFDPTEYIYQILGQ
jgi:hypothetical protein